MKQNGHPVTRCPFFQSAVVLILAAVLVIVLVLIAVAVLVVVLILIAVLIVILILVIHDSLPPNICLTA